MLLLIFSQKTGLR